MSPVRHPLSAHHASLASLCPRSFLVHDGTLKQETGASANSRDTFDGYYDQRVDYSSEDEGKGHR